MKNRRTLLQAGAAAGLALLMPRAVLAQPAKSLHVLKSATCGCCKAWSETMRQAGYTVTEEDLPQEDLDAAKLKAGLKPDQVSCHTGMIEGYVVEGHVPAREVDRLLVDKPEALGLAVPGMPFVSPGMGEAGADAEPYDVLLVKRDGSTEVYASYR